MTGVRPSVIVVRNAHAGSQSDEVTFEIEQVLGQLDSAATHAERSVLVYETQCQGDGVRIGQQLVPQSSTTENLDVVVFGGDGTVSEIVNGIMTARTSEEEAKIRLAVYPAGTANALYAAMYAGVDKTESSRRRSVQALIDALNGGKDSLKSLLPMMNRLLDEGGKVMETTYSVLVTSHALHAAILADADTKEMRAAHQGIERFKVAARLNSTRWIAGSLSLHARSTSGVLQYSAITHRFEPCGDSDATLELDGPFVYLNAMITDRLEDEFVPAPLSSPWAGENTLPTDAIDVVAIRPTRDTEPSPNDDVARSRFAQTRLMQVQTGMYTHGSHIDQTYADADKTVVEYFRCSAYTFRPLLPADSVDTNDSKARLVCMDGTIARASAFQVERCKAPKPVQVWW